LSTIILITVSGVDRPGLMHRLTQVLSEHEVRILDIGQSVIHRTLNMGILAEVHSSSDHLFKDVLFVAHDLDVRVRFSVVSSEEYDRWVDGHSQERYVITLLGRVLRATDIARVSRSLTDQGLNIATIARLSGRQRLETESTRACIELSVRGKPRDASALRKEILVLAQELGIDIAIQIDDMYRRHRRMVCFDMDSTLIRGEVIDELAAAAGVGEEVAAVTRAAMNGDMDFRESLQRRLQLLAGLDAAVIGEIAERLPLSDGAERLISTLQVLGYKTAILSGGFTHFGRHLQQKLGIDYVYANELEIQDGKLTGRVLGPIVDGARKAELLKMLAEREGIHLEQVIAVGDGANDLPMLDIAGLGIAYHAKPKVKESAKQRLSTSGLDGILYLLGVRDRDVPESCEPQPSATTGQLPT
jgi:phosphoserine phosphatase